MVSAAVCRSPMGRYVVAPDRHLIHGTLALLMGLAQTVLQMSTADVIQPRFARTEQVRTASEPRHTVQH